MTACQNVYAKLFSRHPTGGASGGEGTQRRPYFFVR